MIEAPRDRKCIHCGKFFTHRGIRLHQEYCIAIREREYLATIHPLKKKVYHCRFCQRVFSAANYKIRCGAYSAKSARNCHEINCNLNPKKQESNEKLSRSKTGHKHSKTTRDKISLTMKGFWAAFNQIENMVRIKKGTTYEEAMDIYFDEEF